MDNKNRGKIELSDLTLEEVSGGLIVDEGDGRRYWLIHQDGTVIAPVPSLENAVEFAKAYNISSQVMTKKEYVSRFGRELKW